MCKTYQQKVRILGMAGDERAGRRKAETGVYTEPATVRQDIRACKQMQYVGMSRADWPRYNKTVSWIDRSKQKISRQLKNGLRGCFWNASLKCDTCMEKNEHIKLDWQRTTEEFCWVSLCLCTAQGSPCGIVRQTAFHNLWTRAWNSIVAALTLHISVGSGSYMTAGEDPTQHCASRTAQVVCNSLGLISPWQQQGISRWDRYVTIRDDWRIREPPWTLLC